MPRIEFLLPPELDGVAPPPVPASEAMPPWFQHLPKQLAGRGPWGGLTAKACAPFADALAAGYLLPLPQTVYAEPVGEEPLVSFSWQVAGYGGVDNHLPEQLAGSGATRLFKFLTPWHVRLPRGYSALLTHPLNDLADRPFRSFSGVIDGGYDALLNPPFRWLADQPTYLEAGTPVAQIIPVKTEGWRMTLGSAPELELLKPVMRVKSIRDGYRRLHWQRKQWS